MKSPKMALLFLSRRFAARGGWSSPRSITPTSLTVASPCLAAFATVKSRVLSSTAAAAPAPAAAPPLARHPITVLCRSAPALAQLSARMQAHETALGLSYRTRDMVTADTVPSFHLPAYFSALATHDLGHTLMHAATITSTQTVMKEYVLCVDGWVCVRVFLSGEWERESKGKGNAQVDYF
jgi:hypothetical protein